MILSIGQEMMTATGENKKHCEHQWKQPKCCNGKWWCPRCNKVWMGKEPPIKEEDDNKIR